VPRTTLGRAGTDLGRGVGRGQALEGSSVVAWVDLTNNDIGPLGATHLAHALEGTSRNRRLLAYPKIVLILNLEILIYMYVCISIYI